MPSVSVVDAATPVGSATVIVGAHSGPNGPRLAPGSEAVNAALSGRLLAAYRALGGSGQPDEVVKVATLGLAEFPLVVVVGLGPARPAAGGRRRAGAPGHRRRGPGGARLRPGPDLPH